MSDFNSSLPVRTENAGDVIIKVADATITSQQLAVNSDGSVNAVVTATLLDTRHLTFSNDKVDASGSSVKLDDGSGNAITSTSGALDVNVKNSSLNVVVNSALPAGTNLLGKIELTDGTNIASLTASGEWKAEITQPLPTGSNTIGAVTQASGPWTQNLTQVAGSSISLGQKSMANSLPVVLSSDQAAIPVVLTGSLSGTEINDFKDDSAVASGSSANHDYAITATKTFKGKYFHASASGLMKIEIQISADGTNFFTKFVGFNSTANPNIDIQLDMLTLSETGSGSKIRIIKTNKDKSAQDLYSTICGVEQ